MRRLSFLSYVLRFLVAVEVLPGRVPVGLSAELKRETLEGFNRYVDATEARIDKELVRPGLFLYVVGLPEPRRTQVLAELKRGEVYVEHRKSLDASGREIRAPGGLIHDWMGAVFIPGATLKQTLDFAHDYNHHQEFFKPEVVRSQVIDRKGDSFKIFYRLRKHKVITVTLNTEHDVRYAVVDSTHYYSRSSSTRIAQVENADLPGEHEMPVGHDSGFLWRIDSYWRFEERDGGVYIECESVSLTRDIPAGLGWLIRPFISGLPRETLEMTLKSTRAGVLSRVAAVHR